MAKAKKPRLGRGLSSLMSSSVSIKPSDDTSKASKSKPDLAVSDNQLAYLDVSSIKPNPFQPRQEFDDDQIQQLSDSIKQDGVMQPIVVRQRDGVNELVAGERRLRAAEIAGLEVIPAVVRELTDQQIAEWALIENIQRQNLNAVESAQAFLRLSEQFSLTHEQIAERVGLGRVAVTNMIRLLELDDTVLEAIRSGLLTAGHGKALLGTKTPAQERKLAQQAIKGGWSVRFTEKVVRDLTSPVPRETSSASKQADANLQDLANQIGNQLQTKVSIKKGRKKGSGTLMIDFYDLDQFDGILERLGIEIE